MDEMAQHGLTYTHLALNLCGDNLYPAIRDVPPVRGEEPMRGWVHADAADSGRRQKAPHAETASASASLRSAGWNSTRPT